MTGKTRRGRHAPSVGDLLRFETLLTDLSAAFVNVPANEVDREIERWLRRIVEFLGIERSMLAQFFDEEGDFRITHSYAEAGFTPALDVIPREEVPWHVKKMLAGEAVVVSRLDDIPADAARDKETARRFGVKSAVMVPLMVSGTAIGAMTFDALRRERSWPDDMVRRFRLVGKVFANALARKRAQAQIDELLSFERLVSELSATFINLPVEAIDPEIEKGLQRCTEFLGMDRATIYELSDGEDILEAIHRYAAPEIPTAPPVLRREEYPWFFERVLRGETVAMPAPGDLAAEARDIRRYVQEQGIQSVITVPLQVGRTIRGFVGWATIRARREWPDALVQRLRLVGEIFANALERRRAEESLRKSEFRIRRALESAPDGVLLVRPDGTLVFANEQAGWIFGYTREELAGLQVDDLVPGRFRKTHAQQRKEFLRTPSSREIGTRQNLYGRRKDGAEVPVEIGLSPLETSEGLLIYCSVRDVTEKRRVEAEARRLRDELAYVARVATMGELAASFAHELNQPLAAILSNAYAAQRFHSGEAPDPAEVQAAMADIIQDGHRAGEVIRRLRTLFRRHEVERVPLELTEVVEEVTHLLRSDAGRRAIGMRLEFAPDLPRVAGDRIQLQQVLMNLILNAFDAIDRNARGPREVSVRASQDLPASVTVAVRDSGAGIDREAMARIFDPFFTTKPGGMGMGLTISRTIVQAHGGRLWATPNPEGGMSVAFSLPLEPNAPAGR